MGAAALGWRVERPAKKEWCRRGGAGFESDSRVIGHAMSVELMNATRPALHVRAHGPLSGWQCAGAGGHAAGGTSCMRAAATPGSA